MGKKAVKSLKKLVARRNSNPTILKYKAAGFDVYTALAATWFALPPEEITSEQRLIIKTLALSYKAGNRGVIDWK